MANAHVQIAKATSQRYWTVDQEGRTHHFYIRPRIEAVTKEITGDTQQPIPIVVLAGSNISSKALITESVNDLARVDDVLDANFLSSLLVVTNGARGGIELPLEVDTTFGSWNIDRILEVDDATIADGLPAGPYFLLRNEIHQAWKLYLDHLDAFASTVVPSTQGTSSYDILDHVIGDGLYKAVAVPSRLYSIPSPSKPLSGKRVTIKDNFRVAGTKTTLSNRAFVDTYPPERESASIITLLEELGAHIVGKTKLCAFASSEEATDQWIDFHAPFNPRADFYQSPSGSTTGGAAAMSGYDWLDYSIGTDTTGSIRWPAAWHGIFGIRMTFDAASLTGVYPSCRIMDTLGLLGRDLDDLRFLTKTISANDETQSKLPTNILYCTDFFPHSNRAQQAMVEEFVDILEASLGVKRTVFSIAERWAQCPPPEANGKSIQDFLQKTAFYPFYWDGYHEFDQFREDYKKKFKKEVYVGPYMRWKWDEGAKVSEEEVEQSLAELAVYQKWFDENVLSATDNGGLDAILILPCGNSVPKYRDDPNNPPNWIPGFSVNYIASLLSLPQIVVPIGQFPYQSRISGREEHLPVVGSIVGPKGSDLQLWDIASEALRKAGWSTKVTTGRYALKLGNGTRNVVDPPNSDALL